MKTVFRIRNIFETRQINGQTSFSISLLKKMANHGTVFLLILSTLIFFLYHLCCFLHRGIFSNYYYFFVVGYDWSRFRHYTVLWTIRIKWIFNSLQMRYKCCMVTFWGGIRKKVKPDVTPYYTMVSCHWNYSVLWYPKYKVDIAHPSSYKSIL